MEISRPFRVCYITVLIMLFLVSCAPKTLDPRSSSHEWHDWVQVLRVEGFRFEGEGVKAASWTGIGVAIKDNLLLTHATTAIRARSIVGMDDDGRSCSYSKILWLDPANDLAVLYGDDCRRDGPRTLIKPIDPFALRQTSLFFVSANLAGGMELHEGGEILGLESSEELESLRIAMTKEAQNLKSVAFTYANGTFAGLVRGGISPTGKGWLTPAWVAPGNVAAYSPVPLEMARSFPEDLQNLRTSNYLHRDEICLAAGEKAEMVFGLTEAVDVVATVSPKEDDSLYTLRATNGDETRFEQIAKGEKKLAFSLAVEADDRLSISNSDSAKAPFCFAISLDRVDWSLPPRIIAPVAQETPTP